MHLRLDVTFSNAVDDDVAAIAALHDESARRLGRDFGDGPWARPLVLRRLDVAPGRGLVRVGRCDGAVVCSLRLQTKRPWAIDPAYFTPAARALYLVNMVVAPANQRRGIGRAALDDAWSVALDWPADAIRLDAWGAAAGAGPFYERCGYAHRGYAVYRGTPLIYYERRLDRDR
jgi:ribosomal protein S18 acetylase RimI-like enzyme